MQLVSGVTWQHFSIMSKPTGNSFLSKQRKKCWTNTTIERPPDLVGRSLSEAGGLSGRPLFARSTEVLAQLHRLTEGRIPLIGVGGIASGADAYAKIRAGASLVQLYTALIYEGPGLVSRIKAELASLLSRDGFETLSAAVGAGRR